MKQRRSSGFRPGKASVSLIFGINNVPALGSRLRKGAHREPFYWDMNEGTRAWSQRFRKRAHNAAMPNDMQAGVYASVLHY